LMANRQITIIIANEDERSFVIDFVDYESWWNWRKLILTSVVSQIWWATLLLNVKNNNEGTFKKTFHSHCLTHFIIIVIWRLKAEILEPERMSICQTALY
jgi:hypothetical protein